MVTHAATRPDRLVDALVILGDTANVETGPMEVASEEVIKDLGASQAFLDFVVDIAAVTAVTDDELYLIHLQGSNESDFGEGIVNLATICIGAPDATGADIAAADHDGTRHLVAVSNLYQGTVYRYVRGFFQITGTAPALSITRAFLTPRIP